MSEAASRRRHPTVQPPTYSPAADVGDSSNRKELKDRKGDVEEESRAIDGKALHKRERHRRTVAEKAPNPFPENHAKTWAGSGNLSFVRKDWRGAIDWGESGQ